MVVTLHTKLTPGGGSGVDVFFVLSGWLITGILLIEFGRAGTISYRAFLLRRARRLLPALFLMLAAYAAWALCTSGPLLPILFAATSTTDLRECLGATHSPIGHTWSLGVEWQFYVLWPAIVALIAGRKFAVPIMITVWGLLTLVRSMAFAAHLHDFAYFSPLHSTGLFIGAALALGPSEPARRWVGWLGLAAILVTILVAPDGWRSPEAWLIPIAEVGAAGVILSPPRFLRWAPLVWIGTISYGLYLWHLPIWFALAGLSNDIVRAILTLALTIGVSAANWRWLEQPILRGGRRASLPIIEAATP